MTFKFHPFQRIERKLRNMLAERRIRKKIKEFKKASSDPMLDDLKIARSLDCKTDERIIIRMIVSADEYSLDRMQVLAFLEAKLKIGEDISEIASFLLDSSWLRPVKTDQDELYRKTFDVLKSTILHCRSLSDKIRLKFLYDVHLCIKNPRYPGTTQDIQNKLAE